MNSVPARILVAVVGQTVCVKIEGRADFTLSVDLKKLVAELRTRGCDHFIFELRDCLTMDSTFLGVLSGMGLEFSHGRNVQSGTPLELLNPNPRIAETLENLGVADLFLVRNCGELPANDFEPVEALPGGDKIELKRTCLEAHRILMSLNPDNVRKFKDVTQFLAEDLKRLESSGNGGN